MDSLIKKAGLAVAGFALASTAMAGPMYLLDGDGSRILAVDMSTGTVVNTFATNPTSRQFPIAVFGDIRTTGYVTNEAGGQYSMGGAYSGTNYVLSGLSEPVNDGTSDGTYNYAAGFANGGIYRFDRYWANPQFMFTAANGSAGGITYDARDNSLWVSRDRGAGIYHYAMNGTQLGFFDTPEATFLDWDLALDPTDNTLWVSNAFTNNFYNYSTSGDFLGSTTLAGVRAASFFSAEFDLQQAGGTVPEPSSLALIALALVAAGAAGKRRRPAE